jgi:hypothetical protein
MSDNQTIEMENARTFLKILSDRNNQMVGIIHQYTNYTIIALSAIWAFLGKSYFDSLNTKNPQTIFLQLAICISIIVILAWRFYAHKIDDDIAKNYKWIISNEKILLGSENLEPSYSTLNNLIKSCPNLENQLINNNKKCYSQKEEIVSKLIDNRLIGTRGHFGFDLLASLYILIFTVIAWIITHLASPKTIIDGLFSEISFDAFAWILACVLLILLLNPTRKFPIQRDPTSDEIKVIIQKGEINEKRSTHIISIFIVTIVLFLISLIYLKVIFP